VSYARADFAFADALVAELERHEVDVLIDRRDLPYGEEWKPELLDFVRRADAVVYIASPRSVASRWCRWELAQVKAESKRLVPIEMEPVLQAAPPPEIGDIHLLPFAGTWSAEGGPAAGFAEQVATLARVLLTDRGWVKEHTRLGEAARRWEAARAKHGTARARALLLRGHALAEAEQWIARRPHEAPEPTDLHRAYIEASRQAARARTRRTIALAASLSLLAAAAGLGWWQEDYLREQYHWHVLMAPSVLSAAQERELAAKPRAEFKECAQGCPTMVVVPAGTFTMGYAGEKRESPPRQVTIRRPFAVAKFELTFEEWDACAAAGACSSNISAEGWGRGRQPVINVTWQDAQAYVQWLSRMTGKPYRLLSEAEWEYVARAGTATHFFFGNDDGPLGDYAWFAGNAERQARPVGAKKPNPWGLHDVHGNVWEWVEDCFREGYQGAPTDGSVWASSACRRRVIRGGSWLYRSKILRSASRDWLEFDRGENHVGFRVARSLSAAPEVKP
jgi:formylglycine-generating enzyme required for sulfatase activity